MSGHDDLGIDGLDFSDQHTSHDYLPSPEELTEVEADGWESLAFLESEDFTAVKSVAAPTTEHTPVATVSSASAHISLDQLDDMALSSSSSSSSSSWSSWSSTSTSTSDSSTSRRSRRVNPERSTRAPPERLHTDVQAAKKHSRRSKASNRAKTPGKDRSPPVLVVADISLKEEKKIHPEISPTDRRSTPHSMMPPSPGSSRLCPPPLPRPPRAQSAK